MVEVARLHKVENGTSLKAFADVIVYGQMLVKGFRVIEGKNGLFVAMPQSQAKKDGKWYNIVELLNDEAKQELQETVLEAFNS